MGKEKISADNMDNLGFTAARELVLASISPLGKEMVDLGESLGRTLAEDVVSRRALPPWDNSAMDGFAVRAEDVKSARDDNPQELRVIGDLPAGRKWKGRIGEGETVRIMTGAPIPEGADSVVRVEYTRELSRERIQVLHSVEPGFDLRRQGEDIQTGEVGLAAGAEIRPAEIGVMASLDVSQVSVFIRPRVAVLATGDELVDLGVGAGPDQIVSSNTYSLQAQIIEAGGIPVNLGIAPDDPEVIRNRLSAGLEADIVLSSAGVSMGDYDYVKKIYQELGVDPVFTRVRIRPGQPLKFGRVRGKPILGLPGNPVSSMVCFEEFVRPLIRKMCGRRFLYRAELTACLDQDLEKSPDFTHFLRCRLEHREGKWRAKTTGPQGSGILSSMAKADGLLVFPEGVSRIKRGEMVQVHLLRELDKY